MSQNASKYATVSAMVVEDHPDIRSMMREVLSEVGVSNITEAADGNIALRRLEEEGSTINFIISDWNMPNMSGIDFLRQVRSVYPRMPFLMVTGRGDQSSVFEAKAAGVTAYIRKPFSPDQLEARLDRLLASANATLMG